MTRKFPAPWTLHGRGYILAYRFPKRLGDSEFFSQEFLRPARFSGFGTVMLADYRESTAGPYGELLFIPGKFPWNGKKYFSITKIYVSTMESVVNGRENWGIPKEPADFSFQRIDDRRERITVSKDGTTIIEAVIRKGWLPYPLNTRFFPLPLIQRHQGRTYFTRFRGKGKSRLCTVESMRVNPSLFPDVSAHRPLFVKGVDDFTIEFPVAEIQ